MLLQRHFYIKLNRQIQKITNAVSDSKKNHFLQLKKTLYIFLMFNFMHYICYAFKQIAYEVLGKLYTMRSTPTLARKKQPSALLKMRHFGNLA